MGAERARLHSRSGTGMVMGGGSWVGGWMSVVLEEYKNLTDGSGADTSAVRRPMFDGWELGGKRKNTGS